MRTVSVCADIRWPMTVDPQGRTREREGERSEKGKNSKEQPGLPMCVSSFLCVARLLDRFGFYWGFLIEISQSSE